MQQLIEQSPNKKMFTMAFTNVTHLVTAISYDEKFDIDFMSQSKLKFRSWEASNVDLNIAWETFYPKLLTI
jgi:hypothetical protein